MMMRWMLIILATMAAAADPTDQQVLDEQLQQLEAKLNGYEAEETDQPPRPSRATLESELAEATRTISEIQGNLALCQAEMARLKR